MSPWVIQTVLEPPGLGKQSDEESHQNRFPLRNSKMPDRATYLSYKQDQKLLVYWITRACKDIINTGPSDAPVVPVSTGKVSLETLKALSQLITRHNKRIPTIIYQLFWSIIESRQERHRLFLKVVASNPDPSIQKSNDTHSHWINGLMDVFNILGGDSWRCRKT